MTNPLHHARAQLEAVRARLEIEDDDGEWLWLVFYRLERWIKVLEARG